MNTVLVDEILALIHSDEYLTHLFECLFLGKALGSWQAHADVVEMSRRFSKLVEGEQG